VFHQLGQESSLLIVGNGDEPFILCAYPVRIAVRLDKAKDVLHPRPLIPDPDPLRLTVGVQAARPEAFDVGAKEVSLQIVRRVFDGFGEFCGCLLQLSGVVSLDKAD
jgi:hypothetical protein